MGKRQKRIFGPSLLQNKNEFLGKEVSVVTKDARTVRGTINELAHDDIWLLDMSLQKHRIRLENVAEIVLDFETAY